MVISPEPGRKAGRRRTEFGLQVHCGFFFAFGFGVVTGDSHTCAHRSSGWPPPVSRRPGSSPPDRRRRPPARGVRRGCGAGRATAGRRSSRSRRSPQYKPRSTLKTGEHPVPKAKFPVIDIHSHQPTAMSDDQFARVVAGMDAVNLRVLVNASGASGSRLVEAVRTAEGLEVPGPDGAVHRRGLPQRRAGMGREGGRAARGRRQGRRGRARRDLEGARPALPQGRRHAPEARRPRARSGVGGVRPARHPGAHPHRRAAGVLRADRLPERALARAGAVSRSAAIRPGSFRVSRS